MYHQKIANRLRHNPLYLEVKWPAGAISREQKASLHSNSVNSVTSLCHLLTKIGILCHL